MRGMRVKDFKETDGDGTPDYQALCASLRAAQAASPTGLAHARLAPRPAENGLARLLGQVRAGQGDKTCRFRPDEVFERKTL